MKQKAAHVIRILFMLQTLPSSANGGQLLKLQHLCKHQVSSKGKVQCYKLWFILLELHLLFARNRWRPVIKRSKAPSWCIVWT